MRTDDMTLVADLDFLTGRAEFIRFMGRLAKRRDDLAEIVLRSDLDGSEREIERQKFLLLDEIVRSPEIDRDSAALRAGASAKPSLSISS